LHGRQVLREEYPKRILSGIVDEKPIIKIIRYKTILLALPEGGAFFILGGRDLFPDGGLEKMDERPQAFSE